MPRRKDDLLVRVGVKRVRKLAGDTPHNVSVVGVEKHKKGATVLVGTIHRDGKQRRGNPAISIAKAIDAALDPVRVPSKVRTLDDMSAEEIAKLEDQYKTAVVKPKRHLVHIQRPGVLDADGRWWLRNNRGKFFSLRRGGPTPYGAEPLDVVCKLWSGTYHLGCGNWGARFREEIIVDDRYPEAPPDPPLAKRTNKKTLTPSVERKTNIQEKFAKLIDTYNVRSVKRALFQMPDEPGKIALKRHVGWTGRGEQTWVSIEKRLDLPPRGAAMRAFIFLRKLAKFLEEHAGQPGWAKPKGER